MWSPINGNRLEPVWFSTSQTIIVVGPVACYAAPRKQRLHGKRGTRQVRSLHGKPAAGEDAVLKGPKTLFFRPSQRQNRCMTHEPC